MTITERCQILRLRVADRNAFVKANAEAAAISARAQEFGTARQSLARRISQEAVLKQNDVPCGLLPNPTKALTILDQVTAAASISYEDASRHFAKLGRALSSLDADLTMAIKAAVKGIADAASVNEMFLKEVELIPGYAEPVARIRRQREMLLTGADWLASPDILRDYLQRIRAFNETAESLDPHEFPEGVRKFFRAVPSGGAPLGDFTSEVQEWLSRKGLLKKVRVTVVR